VTAMSTIDADLRAVDGRRARGARTRLKVIESLLDLVAEGNVRPTAQEIAAHAGVALRTVYHHFEDVEALRRLALELDMSRHVELLEPVDVNLALSDRIEIVAAQCRRLFEAVTPIRRATLFDQHSSPDMAEGIRRASLARAEHIEAAFAPELAYLGSEGARSIVDSVVVVSSWVTWEYLRTMMHRSAREAEQVLVTALSALLSPTAGYVSGNGATGEG
jgi:TetR/AcrR family transcriptional regulator, regulator of autoinduction and epiphytic fitness